MCDCSIIIFVEIRRVRLILIFEAAHQSITTAQDRQRIIENWLFNIIGDRIARNIVIDILIDIMAHLYNYQKLLYEI